MRGVGGGERSKKFLEVDVNHVGITRRNVALRLGHRLMGNQRGLILPAGIASVS